MFVFLESGFGDGLYFAQRNAAEWCGSFLPILRRSFVRLHLVGQFGTGRVELWWWRVRWRFESLSVYWKLGELLRRRRGIGNVEFLRAVEQFSNCFRRRRLWLHGEQLPRHQ